MTTQAKSEYVRNDPRPQRMCAWFTVISLTEFASLTKKEIEFLDTFVTIEQRGSDYTVFFEGVHKMVSIIRFGLIIAWHGHDLKKPDRPIPELFSDPAGDEYYMSKKLHYPDTHLLDFLENSGDVLHFRTTHKWDKANIEYYDYQEHTMKYMLVGELRYAQSATRIDKRMISKILPKVPTRTEVNFIGPGFVESRAITIRDLKLNALVTITPTGDSGTSIYVILNVNTNWIPKWLQSTFNRLSPKSMHDLLAFVFTHAVIDDLSGDYRIWSKRKLLINPFLLPAEKNILLIREWVESFYPKEFSYPTKTPKPSQEMNWQTLDGIENIAAGKVSTYNVAGEELVAFRDTQGKLVVLDAFCPHHGAHLGYEAKVEGDCVRCPFHHFYFNADGRCLSKSLDSGGKFIKHISTDPRQHRLNGETIEVLV
jgi:nitrite reductase/ring-hydroxylating ferredoxin subunit